VLDAMTPILRPLTDPASAAPASADRPRPSHGVDRQEATRPENARLAGVSCNSLLGGGRLADGFDSIQLDPNSATVLELGR